MAIRITNSKGFEKFMDPQSPGAPGFGPSIPPFIQAMLDSVGFLEVPETRLRPTATDAAWSLGLESDDFRHAVLLQRSGVRYKFRIPDIPTPLGAAGYPVSFRVVPFGDIGGGEVRVFTVRPRQSFAAAFGSPPALLQYSTEQGGWAVIPQGTHIKAKTRVIVLIHGFISSVAHGFRNLSYSNLPANCTLLGFDHDTIFRSPDDNAIDLHEQLFSLIDRETIPSELDVICHSRGGLVARRFLVRVAESHPEIRRNRLMTFGSPHQGTTLAATTLGVLNTILAELLTYAFPGLERTFGQLLLALAERRMLPGVTAMLPGSPTPDCILTKEVACVRAAYTADTWWQETLRFIYDGVAFAGNENDLIVDTANMGLKYQTSELREDHNHFKYFDEGSFGHRPFG